MVGLISKILICVALLGVGWAGGSLYPAPQHWVDAIRGRTAPLLAQIDISPNELAELRQRLSPQRFSHLTQQAALLAASSGDVIRIDRGESVTPTDNAEAAVVEQGRFTATTPTGDSAFEDTLRLCPGMTVANAPPADGQNEVTHYTKLVRVNGDTLAVNPTHGACLSSGVGLRQGHMHKGLDFYSRDGGPIFAAANGVVLEEIYREDYGNMLLIDHGGGVYTRYAHLSSFAPGLVAGAHVAAGQQIGLMGNTAGYSIPVHLHYELLIGDYNNPHGSFGLTPRSPFNFSAATLTNESVQSRPEPIVQSQLTRGETASPFCPGGPLSEATIITIRVGDKLSTIARACYGDEKAWRRIVDCNPFLSERNQGGVSPLNGGDLLYVGDRIAMPAPTGQCPAQQPAPALQPTSYPTPHATGEEATLSQYRAWITEARARHPYADSEAQMYAVMMCESRGQATLVASAGYSGLFQYSPTTWRGAWNDYRDQNILDPRAQIFATALAWQKHMQRQWGCYGHAP
jgi:murein DD-endopeptidase MepM/ murein hydrolase activator NlpD